jgi:hypothetical protein
MDRGLLDAEHRRTLMRYFFAPPLAIALLAGRLGKTPATAGAIAPCGLGTGRTAITIAAVTVAAERHLATTPRTEEPTRPAAHRPLPADEDWIQTQAGRILPVGRATHGVGRGSGETVAVRAAAAPVSTAPSIYTDSLCPVTSRTPIRIPWRSPFAALPQKPIHHPRWRSTAAFTK